MLRFILAETTDEIGIVRNLFKEYADGLGFSLDFQDFESELAQLPGEYAFPGGCIVLAHSDDSPAGVVALRKIDDLTCEMKRLYVKKVYRGYGIGKALSVEIIQMARKIGYQYIRLDTISSMKSAIAIYKSLGFVEIPKYRVNPFGDAKFFELKLNDDLM